MVHLSIIVPVGRNEPYLVHTLKSIEEVFTQLTQLDPYFIGEVIIALDGEDTFVDAEMTVNCVVIPPVGKHSGPAKTRNRALNMAQGTYLTAVDSDDYLDVSGYVDMFTYAHSHPEIAWIAGRIQDMLEDGTLGWVGPDNYPHLTPCPTGWILEEWETHGYLPFHPTASIAKTSHLKEAGGWNDTIPFVRGEDVGLWCAVNSTHEGVWFNRNTLFYRNHSGSITQTGDWDSYGIKPEFARLHLGSDLPSSGDFQEDLRLNAILTAEWQRTLPESL